MINVYISSPLSGNIKRNLRNAVAFARYVFKECGAAPVVPHFYAQVLNDNDPAERKLALEADMSLLYLCQEVWVFGNYWTEGMKEEIKRARMMFWKCVNRILARLQQTHAASSYATQSNIITHISIRN